MILKAFWKHILRAYKYNIFSIQSKEIRALPHFSVIAIIGKHYRFKFPVISICTFVQKNSSASSVCSVIYCHTAIGSILTFPHLWITEIKRTAVFWHIFYCKNWISWILFIIHSIPDSKALGLNITDTTIWLCFFTDACIHKKLFSIWKLIGHVRCQCSRKILPVQQILTYNMPPVHWSPLGIVWIILVK